MLRAEHIIEEAAVLHEVETYNGLLGGAGELGCTLVIEIDDEGQRAVRLREWFALPEHAYVRLSDGTKVRATFDESQRGAGRLVLRAVRQVPRRAGGAGGGWHRSSRGHGRDIVGRRARTALAEDLQ